MSNTNSNGGATGQQSRTRTYHYPRATQIRLPRNMQPGQEMQLWLTHPGQRQVNTDRFGRETIPNEVPYLEFSQGYWLAQSMFELLIPRRTPDGVINVATINGQTAGFRITRIQDGTFGAAGSRERLPQFIVELIDIQENAFI